ncbi:MAG: hypothetical protein U9N77_11165 [Thermodesulfobacteriota bacterium]|nr:hypothetical protein [Thermodesulfobacteriota bacterium]
MIKFGYIKFSQDVSEKVAQCYTTLPEPPAEVKIRETYVFNEEGQDIRAFSIFEYDDSSESIAAEYIKKRYKAFSSVQGLSYTVENWIKVADALEIIGSGDFNANVM